MVAILESLTPFEAAVTCGLLAPCFLLAAIWAGAEVGRLVGEALRVRRARREAL